MLYYALHNAYREKEIELEMKRVGEREGVKEKEIEALTSWNMYLRYISICMHTCYIYIYIYMYMHFESCMHLQIELEIKCERKGGNAEETN